MNIASQVCKQLKRKCTIVAIDVLDQADRPAAKRPNVCEDAELGQALPAGAKVSRSVCGIHHYSVVNRGRSRPRGP